MRAVVVHGVFTMHLHVRTKQRDSEHMSEFHVQVVRLGEIEPLENSDFLGITEVCGAGGYPCIVKTR